MSNHKITIFFTLCVWLAFFFVESGFAAPAISGLSGTIADRQQVSIDGTGFGISGANVVIFDDFERGNIGTLLTLDATVGDWNYSNKYYPVYASGVSRSGSRSMNGIDGTVTDAANQFGVTFSPTTEAFISYAVRIPDGRSFPKTNTARELPYESAWKWVWLYDYTTPGRATGNDDICLPSYIGQGKVRVGGNDTHLQDKAAEYLGQQVSDLSVTGYDPYEWFSFDHWMRQTFWLRDSDGALYWQALKEGVSQTSESHSVAGGLLDAAGEGYGCLSDCWDPAPVHWSHVRFPGWAVAFENTQVVYDDIYVATGPNAAARVEIGNAATYGACTKLAIATPTSWSDTKISITVREGGFQAGESAYLFVVDANNNPSIGFPITIGESYTTVDIPDRVIKPPQNLKAI